MHTALSSDALIDYGVGICAIDSGYVRPRLDAFYLIAEGEHAAFIDTGTHLSLPCAMQALESKGLCADQVEWVIVTHVHLDHAGGAGTMMTRFPRATLAVHPRGARHMIDPSRLLQGTISVYGEETTRRLYVEVIPVSPDRIREMQHNSIVRLGQRELLFLDTPGHARHHLCIVDSMTGHVFAGDTFGVSFRELDVGAKQFVFPTTAPSQFDPQAFHRSLDLLSGLNPGAIYVTHFGQVRDIPRLASDLHRLVDAHAAVAENCRNDGADRRRRIKAALFELLFDEAARQSWQLGEDELRSLMDGEIAMSALGLESWLDARRAAGTRKAGSPLKASGGS
jgi:glyoxylase-like metal-dependent hydrolase (beta-lactamase superfamily II)